MYANVVLEGTDTGTASDNHGFYVITNITSGEYRLKVMMMGYATTTRSIKISAGDDRRFDFELKPVVLSGE